MKQLLEIEKTSDADHNDGEEQLVLELLRAGQLLQLVQRIQGVQPDFRSQVEENLPNLTWPGCTAHHTLQPISLLLSFKKFSLKSYHLIQKIMKNNFPPSQSWHCQIKIRINPPR